MILQDCNRPLTLRGFGPFKLNNMEFVNISLIVLAVAVVGSGLVLAVVALIRSQVRTVVESKEELDSIEEYEEALYNTKNTID